ncbi:MAG: HEAT repeat domain-containing protein [wastewater metagenome]|nr:HEAT repeat domain-containing protein [Candidatus Loosdrechtia aerotolerans]
MGRYVVCLGYVLYAGIVFAEAGAGCDVYKASSGTVHQVKQNDKNVVWETHGRYRTKTAGAVDQYVARVKDTKGHDHTLLHDVLNTALEDDDMEVRAAVVSSLGVLGDRTVVPELLPALHDKEMWVRLAAASAIGEIHDEAVIPELLRLLGDDDARVRESAALALGMMDYRGEIPGLEEAVEEKEVDQRMVHHLLNDVNTISEKDIADYERKLRDRSDIYARIVGVLAFGKVGKINEQAVVKLRKSLGDEEPVVRALAVVVLGKLGDTESLGVIEGLADDDDPVVRSVAALFIGKFGNEKTLPVLGKLIRDEEHQVRASAALAIGRLGRAEGIASLEDLLLNSGHDELAVRLMSVAALWKLTKDGNEYEKGR